MKPSDLYALLEVHKSEAAEGMAYINAFSAAALGVLAYLGAVQDVSTSTRVAMAIAFALISVVGLQALLSSGDMHQAIHTEIGEIVKENPNIVHSEEFREKLVGQGLPPRWMVTTLGLFFTLLMIAAIFLIR